MLIGQLKVADSRYRDVTDREMQLYEEMNSIGFDSEHKGTHLPSLNGRGFDLSPDMESKEEVLHYQEEHSSNRGSSHVKGSKYIIEEKRSTKKKKRNDYVSNGILLPTI